MTSCHETATGRERTPTIGQCTRRRRASIPGSGMTGSSPGLRPGTLPAAGVRSPRPGRRAAGVRSPRPGTQGGRSGHEEGGYYTGGAGRPDGSSSADRGREERGTGLPRLRLVFLLRPAPRPTAPRYAEPRRHHSPLDSGRRCVPRGTPAGPGHSPARQGARRLVMDKRRGRLGRQGTPRGGFREARRRPRAGLGRLRVERRMTRGGRACFESAG